MHSLINSMRLFIVLLVMQTRVTLRCIQSGEKCSFISLLATYPFKKYTFLIKILSSSVKVILFIYITTVVCQGACLPWNPCSWYSTHTKLYELNQSATEWRCLVWKIIMGEPYFDEFMSTCLRVQFFFETQCSYICNRKCCWNCRRKLWFIVLAKTETDPVYPDIKLRSPLINANSLLSSFP